MAKFYLLIAALIAFSAPVSAQGVNTTTGKPVSSSGEPASTVRSPPEPLPLATSLLRNDYRVKPGKNRKRQVQ